MIERPRRILHVDMDAFFASVEQHDFPELRGKPVIVGGPREGRGVVAAASYEARKFGVRSAMPSSRAGRLCPDGIFVKPRFERYKEVSGQVMAIFREHTDLVEPLSLDEAYLDVTENKQGIELGREIAKRIKAEIFARTGLTASAGVGPNKLVAKIASDFRKPDGLTVVAPERVAQFLEGLPVRSLPGVGPMTETKLAELGLRTTTDLLARSEEELRERFGKFGGWLYRACRGDDDRPVQSSRERKSLGAEDTFSKDLTDRAELDAELRRIGLIVTDRLAAKGLAGSTITLKITFADFHKISRAMTLDHRTADPETIVGTASELLDRTEAATGRPVRLLGISLSGFTERIETPQSRQLELPFP
jgi:DNA polymerase IV